MRILGIDEAGRGCVLGDLVIGAFLWEAEDDDPLRQAGAGDSKAIAAAKRLDVRARLSALGEWTVRRISARQIDGANLNALEEAVIVELVRAYRPDVVRVDALGHPATLPALQRRLQAQLPRRLRPQWTIEPRADATWPVVGAASIFAKTTRDEVLDGWRPAFGDFGSGYPSDPKTKAWLAAWAITGAPWPEFVRTRWATIGGLAQMTLL
jgi:ribonuclease HII